MGNKEEPCPLLYIFLRLLKFILSGDGGLNFRCRSTPANYPLPLPLPLPTTTTITTTTITTTTTTTITITNTTAVAAAAVTSTSTTSSEIVPEPSIVYRISPLRSSRGLLNVLRTFSSLSQRQHSKP
uniref:Uncharacterized protein n=1 Tax=Vespula pensylvanica TaxID=30213 RepID=A0A834JZ59_VESPE|nr:hypothetical protein H0235_016654 [Vespula pensylvanica]